MYNFIEKKRMTEGHGYKDLAILICWYEKSSLPEEVKFKWWEMNVSKMLYYCFNDSFS